MFSQCLREETRELNKKRRRYFLDMNGVKYAQASNYCCLRTRLYAHIFLTIDNSCLLETKTYILVGSSKFYWTIDIS